jgi:hypothetical protein
MFRACNTTAVRSRGTLTASNSAIALLKFENVGFWPLVAAVSVWMPATLFRPRTTGAVPVPSSNCWSAFRPLTVNRWSRTTSTTAGSESSMTSFDIYTSDAALRGVAIAAPICSSVNPRSFNLASSERLSGST